VNFKAQGKLLKDKRRELGVTQKEFADSLGYSSAQFISNISRGLSGIPEKDLRKFSKVLKVDQLKLLNAVLSDHESRLRKVMGIAQR
jgi:transcriptional regulator with XRE-family HTH domain